MKWCYQRSHRRRNARPEGKVKPSVRHLSRVCVRARATASTRTCWRHTRMPSGIQRKSTPNFRRWMMKHRKDCAECTHRILFSPATARSRGSKIQYIRVYKDLSAREITRCKILHVTTTSPHLSGPGAEPLCTQSLTVSHLCVTLAGSKRRKRAHVRPGREKRM